MADTKLTALTADTSPALADITYGVKDPSGTPLSRKLTWQTVLNLLFSLTAKTTPVDADTLPLNDTAASNVAKKVTWANIKATLKTYFDTLYLITGNNSNISPTTANVTAAVNTRYFADLSGLTANRNFVVPAGAVGNTIELNIKTGDDLYALIIIGDTGISINGGSTATEWSRLFISGEGIKLVADTTTNWQIKKNDDGRIPCYAVMDRITADITTNTAATDTTVDWNNTPKDNASIADTTNNRFNLRRANEYEVSFAYRPSAAVTDQKYIAVLLFGGASGATQFGYAITRVAVTGAAALALISGRRCLGAAADQVVAKFNTEEANIGMVRNENSGTSGTSWVSIKELFT